MKQAVPFCSKNVQSTSFVNYMLNHCVPVLDTIKVDADVPIEPSVELLQALADLAPHCGDLENPSKQIEPLFDRLMVNLASIFFVSKFIWLYQEFIMEVFATVNLSGERAVHLAYLSISEVDG